MRIVRTVRCSASGYLSVSIPKGEGINAGDIVEIIKTDETGSRRVGGDKPFPPFPSMKP